MRPWEGHDDLAVGQLCDSVLDAASELGDLADQALKDSGESTGHFALGLGFGLRGQAGRGRAQPREQLGRAAATAVSVARQEGLHTLFAKARCRLGSGVTLQEGQRDGRVDVGEDGGGAGPEAVARRVLPAPAMRRV